MGCPKRLRRGRSTVADGAAVESEEPAVAQLFDNRAERRGREERQTPDDEDDPQKETGEYRRIGAHLAR